MDPKPVIANPVVINRLKPVTDWSEWDDRRDRVVKIVIGSLEKKGTIEMATLPEDLATRFENLTHLHLWGIRGLKTLPPLPTGLKCLDVRKCPDFAGVAELPEGLETLVLEDLPQLKTVPLGGSLPQLRDLSFKGCAVLDEATLHFCCAVAVNVELIDLGGTRLREFPASFIWPETVVDLRFNDCRRLKALPPFPPKLRRLELRGAESLTAVPALPAGADYVDLGGTLALQALPTMPTRVPDLPVRPRTLILHGSGVPTNPGLKGDFEDSNVAAQILADIEAASAGREPDHEVKVILLGDSRCGKTSLAKALKDEPYDPRESSTHGINLWRKEVRFTPVDAADGRREDVQLNIWDFAGQDLYHSTHRLFLQSRAIFLLCWTDQGDGSCEATDPIEEEDRRKTEDVKRGIAYWQEQVASLGLMPETNQPPPVMVIRTKVDRGGTTPDGSIAFSAKERNNLDDVKDWIEAEAAKLLGRWEMRSLPAPAMAVKRALQDLQKDKIVSRAAFDAIVAQCCIGLDYAREPKLLLERFHRNGFLYYTERHLPDHVILDQRWAIDGIYKISSRESRYNLREELIEDEGIFTASYLAQNAWAPAGYDAVAQRLFIQFMQSCGMCFVLLREREATGGEKVYAAPGFFPKREKMLKHLPELNAGFSTAWSNGAIQGATEPDMQAWLGWLGGHWSRSAEFWRWGARLRAPESDAAFVCDWQQAEGAYVGTLRWWFLGTADPEFAEFLRDGAGKTFGHHRLVEWPRLSQPKDARQWERAEAELETAVLPEGFRKSGEYPPRSRAVGVRVALSYAGNGDAGKADYVPWLDRVPKSVAAILRGADGIIDVAEYCSDTKESDLRAFHRALMRLAEQDLILCFLSDRYLKSSYCMLELLYLYRQPPEGRFPYGRFRTYLFPGTGIDRSGGKDKDGLIGWRSYWQMQCADRLTDAEAKFPGIGQVQDRTDFLKSHNAHEWFEYVGGTKERENFRVCLTSHRFFQSLPSVAGLNDDEVTGIVQKVAADVLSFTSEPAVLMELAKTAHAEQRFDDAVELYFRWRSLAPDFNASSDDQKLDEDREPDSVLEDLRLRAIACLRDQGKDGGAV